MTKTNICVYTLKILLTMIMGLKQHKGQNSLSYYTLKMLQSSPDYLGQNHKVSLDNT